MTKHIKRLSAIAAAILIITLSVLPTFAAPTGTYVENNATITEYKRLFHGSIRATWATYNNESVLLPVDIQDTWNYPYVRSEVSLNDLIGTWTLNSSSFDFSMISDELLILEGCNIAGYWYEGGNIQSITYTQIAIGPLYSLFQLTDINSWDVINFNDYPNITCLDASVDEYQVSTTDNNHWNEYASFTINSVPEQESEKVNKIYEFLSTNAIKQGVENTTGDFPNLPSNSLVTPYTNITLDGITVPTYSTEGAAEFPEEQRFIFNLTELMLPSGLYTDTNLMIWSGQFFGQNNTRAAEIRVRDMSTEAIYAEWRGRLYFYDSTGIISIVRDVEEATRFSEQFVFDDITLAGSNTIPADYDYWSFEGDISFTVDFEITGSETLRMYFDGVENSYYYSDGTLENATTTNPVNAFYNAIALGGTGTGGTGTLTIYENGLYNVSNYAYVQASIPQEVTNAELPNLFAFLGDAISGFFAVEIVPGFSFGGILVFAAGVAMLFFILKVFMGG